MYISKKEMIILIFKEKFLSINKDINDIIVEYIKIYYCDISYLKKLSIEDNTKLSENKYDKKQ